MLAYHQNLPSPKVAPVTYYPPGVPRETARPSSGGRCQPDTAPPFLCPVRAIRLKTTVGTSVYMGDSVGTYVGAKVVVGPHRVAVKDRGCRAYRNRYRRW